MTLQLRARDIRPGDTIEAGEPPTMWAVRKTLSSEPTRTFDEPRTGLVCDEVYGAREKCLITRHPDDLLIVRSVGYRNTFRVLWRGIWS